MIFTFTQEELKEELEKVFYQNWIFTGVHANDLFEQGMFKVFEIGSISIVLIRDQHNNLRAFHNFCTHRGTILLDKTEGKIEQNIICPYHHWSYNLDGKLKVAPLMKDESGFNIDRFSLKEVKTQVIEGLIFIHINGSQEDLRRRDLIESILRDYGVGEWQHIYKNYFDLRANWKLIVENYLESYHSIFNHPRLERLNPFGTETYIDGTEPYFISDGYFAQDVNTLSLDGKAIGRCSARLSKENSNRVIYGIFYPNILMSLHPDYLLLMLINPISPERSRLECSYYSYLESNITKAVEFWDEANQEDKDICERNQKGHTLFKYDQKSKYFSSQESFCKAFHKLLEQDLLITPM